MGNTQINWMAILKIMMNSYLLVCSIVLTERYDIKLKVQDWNRRTKSVCKLNTEYLGCTTEMQIEKVSRIRSRSSACRRSWSHAGGHVTTWRVYIPLMIVCYIGNTWTRATSAITRVTPNRARAQRLIALLIEVYKEEIWFETAIIAPVDSARTGK